MTERFVKTMKEDYIDRVHAKPGCENSTAKTLRQRSRITMKTIRTAHIVNLRYKSCWKWRGKITVILPRYIQTPGKY